MGDERRRDDRKPTGKGFIISCKSSDFQESAIPGFNLAVKLIDVSTTGACVVTRGRLRTGIAVDVLILTPNGRERYMTQGVVRWSTTVESNGKSAHVAGLEFAEPIEEFGRIASEPNREPVIDDAPEPQRRHRRFRPENAEVLCLPHSFMTKLGFKTNVAKKLQDVSLGGAQIVSDRPLKPGRHVDLRIQFRRPATEVTAEGIVRWCRRDTLTAESRWYVGVTFIHMDRDSSGNLRTVERVFLEPAPAR